MGADAECVWIYVTCGTEDEAVRIGSALVDEGLAACVNVLGPIRSIFRWEGRRHDERETAWVAKTRRDRLDDAVARIRSLHSYSVPCIVALPLAGGHPDFLAWVASQTVRQS